MLAYRLNLREILVVGAEFYRAEGGTHDRPRIGHLPADELLAGRRVLVVDEVWETGETMTEVLARLRASGATPGERRPPLQADPLPRARRARPSRRDRRRLGHVPVQGGRLSPSLSRLSSCERCMSNGRRTESSRHRARPL